MISNDFDSKIFITFVPPSGFYFFSMDNNPALFQYIEGWYNRKRIHSSIGYKTPQAIEDLAKKVA
ncbi:hypothetical protein COO03_25795 [Bacillus sp. AFS098217]|nr:hypothetical protein COO03_25795 [Bacillus sp. AFS098217]PEU17267.1 hypothetical protein CN524_02680 [Bacillus sp. AFS019443]